MCKICSSIYLMDTFSGINDYKKAYISYKNVLLSNKHKFILEKQTCPFENVGVFVGGWYNDIMCQQFKCKECGSVFELFAETYHGGGYSLDCIKIKDGEYLKMKHLDDKVYSMMLENLEIQKEDHVLDKITRMLNISGNEENIVKEINKASEKKQNGLISEYYYGLIQDLIVVAKIINLRGDIE